MKTLNFLILSLLFLTVASVAWAAGDGTEISALSSVDRSTITIGDRIRYRIELIYPEGTQVEAPAAGLHLGAFEVKDYKFQDPEKGKDGKIHKIYEYVISTFTTGDYAIPPLPIGYKTPEGIVSQIFTDKIDIQVASVKPSESGEIKDIRPPVTVKGDLDWWWWAALACAVCGGLGYAVYAYRRQRKKGEERKPQKPPYEEAMESLRLLQEEDWISKGKTKEYYFRISEIVRRYIGRRYEFNGIDCTTLELLEKVATLSLAQELRRKMEDFLAQTDLVKFADHIPGNQENESLVQTAWAILDLSKPPQLIPQNMPVSSGGPA